MTLTFRRLSEPPEDIDENSIRVCSIDYRDISGSPPSRYRLRPWKGRIVSVSSNSGTIWKLIKGHGTLSIRQGECWIGPATRSQLEVADGSSVTVRIVSPQWVGRFNFYNTHTDDAVRFSFRIAVWGLVLAIVSISLSLFR